MHPGTVLVTGGAGFVGSNLSMHLKERYPATRVVAFDNLHRRGSELNLPRLRAAGVEFVHGDIRNPEDFEFRGDADLLVECSAEPSVLAGFDSSPEYVLRTNLSGTLHLLEYCRRHGTKMLFLSTSRVYPIDGLCGICLEETESRYEIAERQSMPGVTTRGISESFPLSGARSLYGATKLASEMFLEEYAYAYGIQSIVNRCGVIAGPWQMGKVDQGVVALWLARHAFGGPLSYIGFGGSGKQVRDVVHIADICDLVELQISRFEELNGGTFTVGGGRDISFSLLELTALCQRITGQTIPIERVAESRPADIPLYLTDMTRLRTATGWTPQRNLETLLSDTWRWMLAHEREPHPS